MYLQANHSSHRPNPVKKTHLSKHLKHHLFAQGVSPACEVVVTGCMKPQAQVAPSGKGGRLNPLALNAISSTAKQGLSLSVSADMILRIHCAVPVL